MYLRQSLMAFCVVLYALFLAGCGGGGGGGDSSSAGGGGTNPPPASNFTLRSSSLDVDVVQGTGLQNYSIPVDDLSITDELLAEVPGGRPYWLLPLVVQVNPGSPMPLYAVRAVIDTTSMSPGTYISQIRVYTRNRTSAVEGGSRYISVKVDASAVAKLEFTALSGSGSAVIGANNDPSQTLSLTGNSTTQWQVASDQTWLTLSKTSGTGPDSFQANVDSSGLSPGTHQAIITLDTDDPFPSTQFRYTFYLSVPSLSFDGDEGVYSEASARFAIINGPDGRGSDATATIHYTLGTGTVAYPYSLSFDNYLGIDWLTIDAVPDGGTIDGNGVDLNLSVDPAALAPGVYSGALWFSTSVGSKVFNDVVNVRYYKEPHRIYAQTRGFAFLAAPDRTTLSRQVKILSSFERADVPWQASANQPWLSVTSAGVTGDTLQLTVDPSGLTAGAFYQATVSITSSDPQVNNTEVLQVGFDYQAIATTDQSLDLPLGGGAPDAFRPYLVASPIEPLVFVGVGNTLNAYHIRTGALVRSFASEVTEVGPMTISDDGQHLYVFDAANQDIVQLNAQTTNFIQRFTPFTGYTMTLPGQAFPLHPHYVRPLGAGQLISVGDAAYHSDDLVSAQYITARYLNEPALTVAPGDASIVVQPDGATRQLGYSQSASRLTATNLASSAVPVATPLQACVNAQHTQLFTLDAQANTIAVTDIDQQQLLETLTLPGLLLGIHCHWNGQVVVSIDPFVPGDDDIYILDGNTRSLLDSMGGAASDGASLLQNGLVISGDGSRVVMVVQVDGGADALVLMAAP